VRVLFVCLGNICRSPTAEAVLAREVAARGLAGRIEVDSAGTIGYHAGDRADPRMREAAAARGYELTSVARQVVPEDFERSDLVVAMDRSNLEDLQEIARDAGPGARGKLRLFSDFLPDGAPVDVPDPYWGGPRGFDRVIDLIEEAVPGILDELPEDEG